MSSTKLLLKQLESLSKPRNFEEAKAYDSLAQLYFTRYSHLADAFSDHTFEAACSLLEFSHKYRESYVDSYYNTTAMAVARKQTRDREARKIVAWRQLIEHIKCAPQLSADEKKVMKNYAYENYHYCVV